MSVPDEKVWWILVLICPPAVPARRTPCALDLLAWGMMVCEGRLDYGLQRINRHVNGVRTQH